MNAAQLVGIAKSYGEVKANDGVDLTIRAGTIHALVGENGAGKSTAMKILFGMVPPDAGKILFGGREVQGRWDPHRAGAAGVGMVHQHFMLAGPESVLDNLVLGVEDCRFGVRRRARERAALEKLMGETGLRVPLNAPVEGLPVGLQSRCEILKVLYRKARFLILDEPTAVLTPSETADLLRTLRVLRDSGHTVLVVTHKLKEVMDVADEATVLRAGKTVATRKISGTSVEELSELMVGRRLVMPTRASGSERNARSECASIPIGSGEIVIRAGEITGIAGVEGNGQEEIVRRLVERMAPRPASFAFIPGDRHREALVLPFTLTENLRLTRKFHPAVPGRRLFHAASGPERALLAEYDVRPPKPELAAEALSGGNQQKLIVARELSSLARVPREPSHPQGGVILAVHPTRGVDVGAIEFIHSRLLAAAESGAGVLLISSELDELMALSHRIGALYRGSITAWFEGPDYDERKIGLAMLGGGAAEKKSNSPEAPA